MKLQTAVAAGLLGGALAWFVVLQGLGVAVGHVMHLMGMTGGTIEGPWVAFIGGALYAVGLLCIIVAGLFNRWPLRATFLVVGGLPSLMAEFAFASFIIEYKRFISPDYDSLPGPRPVQLADDTTILWNIAGVTTLHVALFALSTIFVFVIVRTIAKQRARE